MRSKHPNQTVDVAGGLWMHHLLILALWLAPNGGCCNTLGVCHQLNNEFELKHGKLGGDEYVKAESINRSPT